MKYYTNFILTMIALLLGFYVLGTHDFIPSQNLGFLDKKTGKFYIVNEYGIAEIDILLGKRTERIFTVKPEKPNQ